MKSVFRDAVDGAHHRIVSELAVFGTIVDERILGHSEAFKSLAKRAATSRITSIKSRSRSRGSIQQHLVFLDALTKRRAHTLRRIRHDLDVAT